MFTVERAIIVVL